MNIGGAAALGGVPGALAPFWHIAGCGAGRIEAHAE